MASYDLFSLTHGTTRDSDLKSVVEQVANMGTYYQPGSKNDDSLHL
jgi:hypothetical protein